MKRLLLLLCHGGASCPGCVMGGAAHAGPNGTELTRQRHSKRLRAAGSARAGPHDVRPCTLSVCAGRMPAGRRRAQGLDTVERGSGQCSP